MKSSVRVLAAIAAGLLFSGCVTDEGYRSGTEQSISIPYDPYDYDPDDLQAEAQAHCEAFGRNAVYQDETVDPTSVRWRYRHYLCV